MKVTIELTEDEVDAVLRLVKPSYGLDTYFRSPEHERVSDVMEKILKQIPNHWDDEYYEEDG